MKPALKLFFYLVVISAIAANLAAPATASGSETLTIGIPHSEAFTYANMMRNSFEMALEDINKAGGIRGQPIKLVYADDQGKPKRAAKISSVLAGGAGGVTSKKFVAAAGTSANNLLTATLWTPQLKYPGTKAYYDQYVDRHGTPPDYHGAEAYSALLVAADVLKRADTHSPESIRVALDETDLILSNRFEHVTPDRPDRHR